MKNNIAISCVFSNPQYSRTTPRALELVYLKDLLESRGNKVNIIGKKCRTNKDLDFFLDISELNSKDFGVLILQLAPENYFGGVVGDYTLEAIKEIAKFKGEVCIIPTDPRIKPINPATSVNKRFDNILGDKLNEDWESIIKNATYLFPGKDLNKFWNDDVERKVSKFDWFSYIFYKGISFSPFVEEKEYDVIYYGDRRGSYRENKIKKLMPYSTKNLLLGYKSKLTYADFKKKVNHSELIEVLNKSKVSLVIGDKEHEDNVATFRLYEALSSSTLAAIDIDYDPNKEYIKNEELRDILYVENMNDVKRLSDKYCERLIKLQQEELNRIFYENNLIRN